MMGCVIKNGETICLFGLGLNYEKVWEPVLLKRIHRQEKMGYPGHQVTIKLMNVYGNGPPSVTVTVFCSHR